MRVLPLLTIRNECLEDRGSSHYRIITEQCCHPRERESLDYVNIRKGVAVGFIYLFFCIPFSPFLLSHVLNYRSEEGIIGHEGRDQLRVGGASLGQYYLDHWLISYLWRRPLLSMAIVAYKGEEEEGGLFYYFC